MNIPRYITGWAAARVSGAEPEKIFSALAERGISFWNAGPPRDFAVEFALPWRAAKLVPPLAEALGCQGEIVARHGLPALFSRLRRRLLPFFALAVLAALAASSAYIWDIEITGNETIPNGVIRQALAECGVDIGARWTDYSQDLVRNGVILRIPEIRWMTVSMQGCRAVVTVREKRTYIEPVDESVYGSVVAEKAGLVTEINALRGTAVTAVNRTVLPGETLIGGYATGRLGVQGPVRAIGTVQARTWYEITMEAPLTVAVKTGGDGEKTLYALILGKNRINFYKGSSICPADCDKIIIRHTAAKEGSFFLPLTLEKIVLSPYTVQEQEALELRGEMERALLEELARRIGDEGEVLSAVFTASEADGVLYVTLRAECREQIGVPAALTADELMEIQSRIPDTEDTDP